MMTFDAVGDIIIKEVDGQNYFPESDIDSGHLSVRGLLEHLFYVHGDALDAFLYAMKTKKSAEMLERMINAEQKLDLLNTGLSRLEDGHDVDSHMG